MVLTTLQYTIIAGKILEELLCIKQKKGVRDMFYRIKHETALYKGLCQAIVTFSCQSTSEHHINLTSLFYSNSFFRILQLIIPESA